MIPILTRVETLDDGLFGLGNLQREMNRLLEGYAGRGEDFPAINVWSNPEKAVITAELPGMDPAAINIAVQGDVVTLSGERKAEELDKDEVLHRQERRHGQFSRSVRLPYAIAPDKVSARYNRGLLEVTLPRHEGTKPRRIAVAGD